MALDTNLPMTGANGSTTITDTTGNFAWSAVGNAQIQSNALLLDGTDDYIQATINDTLLIGNKDFRISFDAQIAAADAGPGVTRIIVDQIDTPGGSIPPPAWSWQIYVQSGSMIFNVYRSGSNPNVVSSAGNIADGTMKSYVIERIGGTMPMYVNGVLATTAVNEDRYYGRLGAMYIGARRGPNSNPIYDWKGSIRNFSIEIFEYLDPTNAVTRSYVRVQPIGWNKVMRVPDLVKTMLVLPTIFLAQPGMQASRRWITRGVPPWWGATNLFGQLPTYKIRGRVMQRDPDTGIDTPLPLVRVSLFFRRLHTLVDIQRSDDDGYVQFDNLMPGPQGYYAVAFDPEGAPMQNAVIYDRLSSEPGP